MNAQTFIHRLELERAEAECQRALKLDSEFAFAHLLLAHTKFLRRDYVQSLRQYERVLELDPSNREALRMIAEVRKLAPRVPAGKGGGTR